MDEIVKKLVDKILTIPQEDYRVADIIFKKGFRWKYSGNKILNDEKYNGSILKLYLRINGLCNNKNLNKLLNIINKYNIDNNLVDPDENELVMHLRLGDYINYAGILTKSYINLIKNMLDNNPNINKLTIVTAFSYGSWSKESLDLKPKNANAWEFTKAKERKNINNTTKLVTKIKTNFPNLELDIKSTLIIDQDICYCVMSKYFINDIGGFSNLLMTLNNLRKRRLMKLTQVDII